MNPAAKASPPKVVRKEPNDMEIADVLRIRDALQTEPLMWQAVILLMIATGRGEVKSRDSSGRMWTSRTRVFEIAAALFLSALFLCACAKAQPAVETTPSPTPEPEPVYADQIAEGTYAIEALSSSSMFHPDPVRSVAISVAVAAVSAQQVLQAWLGRLYAVLTGKLHRV